MRIAGSSLEFGILNNMARNNTQLGQSLRRLSTGLRVNSSADDVVGMAVGQKMESQIRGMRQAAENVAVAQDMFKFADDTLGEVQSVIQRMRELAVHAASDTATDEDRTYIQSEVQELTEYVDNLIGNAQFNKIDLFRADALEYFEKGAISAIASNETEKLQLKETVSNLLTQNLELNDIYTSIFDLLERRKSEKLATGEIDAEEAEKIIFDKEMTSAKILKIENIDLSTLEKATDDIQRIDNALDRVMSYEMPDIFQRNTASALPEGNIALNQAYRGMLATLEQMEKNNEENSYDNEKEENEKDETSHALPETISLPLLPEDTARARKSTFLADYRMRGNTITIQSGPNEGDRTTFDLGHVSAEMLGLFDVDMTSRKKASRGITQLDEALDAVSRQRATIGAQLNRMDHMIDNLNNSIVNLESARSGILETDVANEMTALTRAAFVNQLNEMLLKEAGTISSRPLDLLI